MRWSSVTVPAATMSAREGLSGSRLRPSTHQAMAPPARATTSTTTMTGMRRRRRRGGAAGGWTESGRPGRGPGPEPEAGPGPV